MILLPLLFLLIVAPIVPVLVFIWLVGYGARLSSVGRSVLDHPAALWAGRAVLVVVFWVGLRDLLADTFALV